MKLEKVFCALFTILISSCQTNGYSRPRSPLCIILSDASAFCKNGGNEYVVEKPVDYFCTNPTGFDSMERYLNCLERELNKCAKMRKKCNPSPCDK